MSGLSLINIHWKFLQDGFVPLLRDTPLAWEHNNLIITFYSEKYPRGRRGSPAKGVVREKRSQGSNPCFSAINNLIRTPCSDWVIFLFSFTCLQPFIANFSHFYCLPEVCKQWSFRSLKGGLCLDFFYTHRTTTTILFLLLLYIQTSQSLFVFSVL